MMKVAKFEKISIEQFKLDYPHENAKAIYDSIILPKRATSGSAGYDFYAPFDFTLKQGESTIIPTGIRVQIFDGYFLGVFPRSSLGFKFRLQLDNTVGIIDSDYFFADNEGHIKIKLTNDAKSELTAVVSSGTAFAQGIFIPFGTTFDDSADGIRSGGFGSTDK